MLNIQIRQGQGKYDQIQLGASRDFDPNPVEYSFFPVREVLVQEGTYETIQIPVTDLQLPEGGGYIAVRATCSELVYDRPYPDKGPWNPYANFVGYDFDKQEYTFSKVNSMYGSICFRFPPDIPFPMACDVLITGSGYWEPITVSAVYDPWNKDSLFNGDTFLMIQKEMKYHLLIAQIIPTPVITMAQLFISQQLVIKQV